MRTIFTILLFMAIAPSDVYSDEPDKTLHNKCIYPTVIVQGQNSFGTGFIVRSEKISDDEYRNVVISCAHCFQHRGLYKIGVPKFKNWSTFEGYDHYPAYVYQFDQEKDLALILFRSKNPVPVAEMDFGSSLYIGSELLHVGCGMGDEHRVDFGKVTSLKSMIKNSPVKDAIRTSVYSIPGDSGGPVYHKCKVIGITQAIRGSQRGLFPGISYAIPIGRLKTWSKELNNALDFMYESEEKMPIIPFFIINWGRSNTEKKMMTSNRWTEGF